MSDHFICLLLFSFGIISFVEIIFKLYSIEPIHKNVDSEFSAIGFRKIDDDEYGVTYERYNQEYDYMHVIYIGRRASGRHIVQSYDKEVNIRIVGLTTYEMELCVAKMKEKGLYSK